MEKYRKTIGTYGEDLACQFLQKHGYTIIARNFSSSYGELDIIALNSDDCDALCCIEVKTRLTTDYGLPEEAITSWKIKKLHETACSYFYQNKIEHKLFRLDVVSILIDRASKKARIKHLKGIGHQER